MVVRGGTLTGGMARYLRERIEDTENIEVQVGAELIEIKGEKGLEAVKIKDIQTGESHWVSAAAVFVFIGTAPRNQLAEGLLELDQDGFILTGQDLARDGRRPQGWTLNRDPFRLETSVPGIFAAGDVRHDAIRRVGSAVGEGAMAASLVDDYLKTV